jgi:hypothetical protein
MTTSKFELALWLARPSSGRETSTTVPPTSATIISPESEAA